MRQKMTKTEPKKCPKQTKKWQKKRLWRPKHGEKSGFSETLRKVVFSQILTFCFKLSNFFAEIEPPKCPPSAKFEPPSAPKVPNFEPKAPNPDRKIEKNRTEKNEK